MAPFKDPVDQIRTIDRVMATLQLDSGLVLAVKTSRHPRHLRGCRSHPETDGDQDQTGS
jgi:hypothetical protein